MAHVGHSAVHAGTSMAIFGGYGHRQYWNELVLLDTGTMTWMRPHTSGVAPHPCVLHSAVVVRDLMVVYGGALDEKPLDQLVALDLVELRWSRLGYAWGGLRPLPRFGHAAAAIGSRIFVFGGTRLTLTLALTLTPNSYPHPNLTRHERREPRAVVPLLRPGPEGHRAGARLHGLLQQPYPLLQQPYP